jgi:peptide/nickel transport system permease protein
LREVVFNYIIRRLIYAVGVILGVSVIVFALMHLSGDPAALFLPPEASAEDIDEFSHAMGFDQPVLLQYALYLSRALRGDFGMSLMHARPALGVVLERVPATAELGATAMFIGLAIGVPSGLLSALKKDSVVDSATTVLTLLGQAVPNFWLGIVLILVFAVNLRLLPASGRGGPQSLILPGFTLGAYPAAVIARLLRSELLEVLSRDYIVVARSKGLRERVVVYRHALRNAAIPVVTVLGLQIGRILGGAMIVEQVFGYPGMGRLVLQAIANRDYAVVQAFVIIAALVVTGANLSTDIAYMILDPRIRYE